MFDKSSCPSLSFPTSSGLKNTFKKKKEEYFKEGVYSVLNSVGFRLIQKLVGWRKKITHYVRRFVLEPCRNLRLPYEGSSSGVTPNPGFYHIICLFQVVMTWNDLVNALVNRFCLNYPVGTKKNTKNPQPRL